MRCTSSLVLLVAVAVSASAATSDLFFATSNLGRLTQVPNGEVSLYPQLTVTPPRKTLLSGESVTLSARGTNVTAVTWFLIENPSGGTITPVNSTSVLYTAGSTSSVIDIVEAWDGTNQFGRSYFNVISSTEAAQAGKAVILAGRRGPTDSVWPVTDYLADSAFNVLRYRGYTKENIQYLSPEPDADVDGNGALDDIDLETTHANAALTFTNWASNVDKLFVYLVDHGGDSSGAGYFRLSATETLTASNLDLWLDDIQNAYHTEVTVLIDCCYAGSFLDEMTYTGAWKRVVIAACGTNEATFFVAGGLVSFSDAFYSGIMLGYDVDRSWNQAKEAMSTYQSAAFYENVAGSTSNLLLGASFVAGKDIPQIGLVCGNQLLVGGDTAVLWADDIASIYPIERVWCLVVPPGHNPDPENPVSDLPVLELPYDTTLGRYQTSYNGFTVQGTYKVIYYARDNWYSVSLPRQSYVIQQGCEERAVLVAAGTTNSVNWPKIDWMARDTYHTLQTRLFDHSRIYYVSASTNQDFDGDGTNDVDAAPSLAVLAGAITNWAATTNFGGPALKLTVILVGEGTNQTLQVNDTEYLAGSELDGWIDLYEMVSNSQANIVIDFSGSGALLTSLAGNTNRITIASCKASQPAIWDSGGLISFTKYFMSHVFKGSTIADSFGPARAAMRNSSGAVRQDAQLDDNGNGTANERTEGLTSSGRYIGSAFVTGADSPEIGSVTESTVLAATNSLLLWAADVSGELPITNVWCIITPPDYTGSGGLSETNLAWNAGDSRYEALYTNFTVPGSYACTFYAVNSTGEISAPVQCEVCLGDAWEVDDGEAAHIDIGVPQERSFHATSDVDYVRFYAVTDYLYDIKTVQQGTNVNTVLDVFWEQPDHSMIHLFTNEDISYPGIGEEEWITLSPPGVGWYYVRVTRSPDDPDAWGPESDYDLSVDIQIGADMIVVAVNMLNTAFSPPSTKVIIDNTTTQVFGSGNSKLISGLSAGIHTIRVTAAEGYLPEEATNLPDQVQNLANPDFGNPRRVKLGSSPGGATFQFVPYGRAEAILRDRWTGQRLGDAQIEFTALNGIISNLVYKGYPGFASYRSNWFSAADGSFPTNVLLPTVDYSLTVKLTNYANGSWTGIVQNLSPAAVTNLGTLYLSPVDTNGNNIADAWERLCFGAGTNVIAGDDTDGDGSVNGDEYRAGTDPKDEGNSLRADVPAAAGGSFTLTWPVAAGRNYRVLTIGNLASNEWGSSFGPQEATNGQQSMSWTDSISSVTARFYHIRAELP